MIPVVVGSNPIGHPNLPAPKKARKWRAPARRELATAGSAFRAVCSAALAQIESNAGGFARSCDAEFLHQLRVGLRRLRAALRAFRPVLPKRPAKTLARSLRKFAPALGAARDWDVFCAWLQDRVPELKSLNASARRKCVGARRKARVAIASSEFRRTLDGARQLAERSIDRVPIAELAREALEKSHRKAMKKARRIRWHDGSQRHALRVRLKRLRYACEYFAPCFESPAAARYVGWLKAMQEILGDLNDIAVGRSLLSELPAAPATLAEKLDARQAKRLSELPRAWGALQNQHPFWKLPR